MVDITEGRASERVWDPIVRLTHWTIAAAVLLNGLIVEEESAAHVWIGYVAFALLALRLLWGLIGTEEARFSAFPPSLSAARAHVLDLLAGRRRAYRSHNPLGALMIYALWGTLMVVSVSGVMLEPSPLASAPATVSIDEVHEREDYGEESEEDEDDEGEDVIEEIHEAAANLLLILAAFHVAGVAVESRLSGGGLVRAMVTGTRARRGGG